MTQIQEQPKRTAGGISLAVFCGLKNDKYQLAEPFTLNGWRYATNGRIVVRVPDDKSKNTKGKIPPVETLPWPPRLVAPQSWPSAEYHFVPGRTEKEADWTWRPSMRCQRIACWRIRPAYHYLISLLPGVRFSTEGEATKPLHFKFRGGEGLLMGMSYED